MSKYTEEQRKQRSRNSYEWKKRNPDKAKEMKHTYTSKNRETLRAKAKKFAAIYKETRPLKAAVCSAKARSRKNNLDFNLDDNNLIIPEFCPYLNIPIILGQTKASDNSPSLDRKDPKKGYTMDNVQVISNLANRMKSNATEDLLILFAENVLKIHKNKENTNA